MSKPLYDMTWVWFQPGVMWPCGLSLLMVLSLQGFFSRYQLIFLPSRKPTFSKFQVNLDQGPTWKQEMWLSSLNLVICSFCIYYNNYLINNVILLLPSFMSISHVLFSCYFGWFFHSYDLILLADPQEFLKKFLEFNANMVFSAEGFCWPDRGLKVSAKLQLSYPAYCEQQ